MSSKFAVISGFTWSQCRWEKKHGEDFKADDEELGPSCSMPGRDRADWITPNC
jgi:hypothetical protein